MNKEDKTQESEARKRKLLAIEELPEKFAKSLQPVKELLEELKEEARSRHKRGGARKGAGRKKVERPANRQIIFRLTEDDTKLLESLKEENESLHQTARRILKTAIGS